MLTCDLYQPNFPHIVAFWYIHIYLLSYSFQKTVSTNTRFFEVRRLYFQFCKQCFLMSNPSVYQPYLPILKHSPKFCRLDVFIIKVFSHIVISFLALLYILEQLIILLMHYWDPVCWKQPFLLFLFLLLPLSCVFQQSLPV